MRSRLANDVESENFLMRNRMRVYENGVEVYKKKESSGTGSKKGG